MIERLVALAVLAAAGVYLANAWPLALGTTARPGPGFFPLSVGAFGAIVAASWVMRAFRRAPADAAAAAGAMPSGDTRARVVASGGVLVGFCLLLPWVGYAVAAFLFTGFLLRRLGAGWTGALVTAIVSALGSWYLFGVLLGVPLPRGALFD
ncbi:MAG: tripartite tricarboxylate transporter TctB family protein [Candidatus Rokuibacteriota bacterium]